jgi:two-component system, LytTR family, response regulator
MIKAILVDDEHAAIKTLEHYLLDYNDILEVIGSFLDADMAIEKINELKPDVLFLDIQMPKKNGFELLNHVQALDIYVVFCTAYDIYALQAIKFNTLDYLLKPIDPEELKHTMDKVNKQVSIQQLSKKLGVLNENTSQPTKEKIYISNSEGINCVYIEDIIRMEADSNYTHIYLQSKKRITVSKTLKEFEAQLSHTHFKRVHQSHIVNVKRIIKYLKENGGSILMDDNSLVVVSRRMKKDFLTSFLQD